MTARFALVARSLLAAVVTFGVIASFTGQAAALAGPERFGLAPATNPQNLPYFSLSVAGGKTAKATLIAQNFKAIPQSIRLVRAIGATSPTSGDAYNVRAGSCVGPACWIRGLPGIIRIPGHTIESIPFTVSVPAGTTDGQYLAGITGEPAVLPNSVVVGHSRTASARAVIINEVTIGVAVTVGPLSSLRNDLTIATLQGGNLLTLPRLLLHLANHGQTFSKGSAAVACRVGTRTDRFTVVGDTVLPGDQAVLPINARSIGFNKTVPCTVRLISNHGQVATWSGLVRMPATAQPTKTYHTGNGVYTSLPARNNGIPSWAIAVIVIGSLCLVGMGGMAFWILRRGGLRRA